MVVKLSAFLWIRNNDLVPISESETECVARGIYGITKEERHQLGELVRQLDEVTDFHVKNGYEFVQDTKDSRRYGQLLDAVYEIMKKYRLSYDFYRRLGEAFADAVIEPKQEIKDEVSYALEIQKDVNLALNSDSPIPEFRFSWTATSEYYEKYKGKNA